jgi:hypothetical protein
MKAGTDVALRGDPAIIFDMLGYPRAIVSVGLEFEDISIP